MNGWCMTCNDAVELDAEGRCQNCGEYCCDEAQEVNDRQPQRDAVVLWPYGHQLFAGSQARRKRVIEEP